MVSKRFKFISVITFIREHIKVKVKFKMGSGN